MIKPDLRAFSVVTWSKTRDFPLYTDTRHFTEFHSLFHPELFPIFINIPFQAPNITQLECVTLF